MENDVTKLDQDNRSGAWRMATILLLSMWAKAATVVVLIHLSSQKMNQYNKRIKFAVGCRKTIKQIKIKEAI